MRNLLYRKWATCSKWYRYQPLDYIKEYFGVKIGLYFAWLGYYTYMLLLASIVGIGCFLYSWFTMDSHKPAQEICSGESNIKMCPLCDHWCDYWDLKDTCVHARLTYLFDNSTTVFFAIFMSFWGESHEISVRDPFHDSPSFSSNFIPRNVEEVFRGDYPSLGFDRL